MIKLIQRTYIIAFLLYILLPAVLIILLSFSSTSYLQFPPKSFSLKWYNTVFENPKWINALLYSLKVGAISSILSTAISLSFVHGIEKANKFFRFFFLSVIFSSILTPAIVIGISLFFWFSTIQLIESPISLILSHTLISVPIAVWILYDANKKISYNLDKTSLTLGHNHFQSYLKVRLPLLKYSLIISMILTFIISFDEPVISLFITSTTNITLPKAMWDGIRYEINPATLAVSALMIVFTTTLTVITILTTYKKNRDETELNQYR